MRTMKTPEEFMEYFRTNYPGPDTIIHSPDWHAPKIYRAAIYASGFKELYGALENLMAMIPVQYRDHPAYFESVMAGKKARGEQ